MERVFLTPAVAADAAAVTEVIVALESSLYGQSAFSQADLEDEWAELDLEQNTRVVRDRDRIVGYGAMRERGELWRRWVRPPRRARARDRAADSDRAREGRGPARRTQDPKRRLGGPDSAARRCSVLGCPVRVFRELRIELKAPPPAPEWPDGLQVPPFDPNHDARVPRRAPGGVRGSWESTPRDFESWSRFHLESGRFDPTLWCAVRAGDEIAAGTICTSDTYGGGWVHVLFTRRPWRKQGVGAALLRDSFGRFWERASTASGSASTRQATPARFASTSAPE